MELTSLTGFLKDEAATRLLGELFAQACETVNLTENQKSEPLIVYLEGELGAGKSFFSRSFIQYFLPGQKVKSPTYTLVESYSTQKGDIQHYDLYRLCDPEELEFLGFRDLLKDSLACLVEWPSKASGILPAADIRIMLTIEGKMRSFTVNSLTVKGNHVVNILSSKSGMVFV